ncbi:hypothetical protein LZC95_07050 [Pendulispora brunnea]|uniref:Uncharacterized protein n=1 Tax=Pendulispora brunnea TaxID=2905690 RepID=A0ABZ2KGZ5_9BACT
MKPRDPRRWLDQSGPETEMERALLDVGREMEPPPQAKDAVWAAIVGAGVAGGAIGATAATTATAAAGTGTATGASAGAGAGTAAATSATGATGAAAVGTGAAIAGGAATTTKVATATFGAGTLLKVTTAIGVLGVTASIATSPSEPSRVPPRDVASASASSSVLVTPSGARPAPSSRPIEFAPQPSFRSQEPAIAPPSEPRAPSLPAPAPGPEKRPALINPPPVVTSSNDMVALPPAVSTLPEEARVPSGAGSVREAVESEPDVLDQLADEAALVSAARRELRQGRARSARTLLERGAATFAGGTLEEERQVLYVESLVKTGSLARAKLEAANFLRAHPTSPHADRLRALIGAGAPGEAAGPAGEAERR